MTKSLKDVILERDRVYADSVRKISLLFVERLFSAIEVVLFNGHDVDMIMGDINIVPQNLNYVTLVMLVTINTNTQEQKKTRVANTLAFPIPIDILEKGTVTDIIEYLEALKNDVEATSKPVPSEMKEVGVRQKIVDRVNYRDIDGEELQLDDIQKELIKFTQVTEIKH